MLKDIAQHTMTSFMTLFPVFNPIGMSFIVNSFFKKLTNTQRIILTRQLIIYSFMLCVGSLLLGQLILYIFHLSIPIVKIGGGILICKLGLNLLSSTTSTTTERTTTAAEVKDTKVEHFHTIKHKLFYPITFPVVIDAGTISVIFALAANSFSADIEATAVKLSGAFFAIILCCITLLFCITQALMITRKIGESGAEVINKLCAFFTFCVGLNMLYEASLALIKEGMLYLNNV